MKLSKFAKRFVTINSVAMLLSTTTVPILQPRLIKSSTVHAASTDDSGVSTWSNWGTVKWGIDSNGTLWIKPQSGTTGTLLDTSYADKPPWYSSRSSIKSVKLEGTIIAASNSSDLFAYLTNCTDMNLTNLDVSRVSNMSRMFYDCSSLVNLDISSWDTSKVTDMRDMFDSCSSLANLDVSKWNTSNVTSMSGMFGNCKALTNLDVSNWDTSKVTRMIWMFQDCSSLTNLDVSKWNTSKVTDMSGMFQDCKALTGIPVSNWNTSKVTDMNNMFSGCSSLTNLNVSRWNTSKVTDMSGMFNGCSNLASLDISSWNTSEVTDMDYIFYDCSKLSELKLGKGFKAPPGRDTSQSDPGDWWSDGGDEVLVSPSGPDTYLQNPSKTVEYTGRWSKADGSNGMSASEMMGLTGEEHDATGKSLGKTLTQEDRAGTWVWERGYTVTLDPNGGSGSTKTLIAVLSQDQVFGKDSASVYITNPGYTKSGLQNFNVSEQKDGSGTRYQYPFTYKTTSNKTLYAQWQKPTYTIKFDANNGSGLMANETMTHGSSKTLSKNTFTRKTYDFASWNTKKDGTGKSYTDQQSVLDIAAAGETITLYAQWKKASWYDSGMSKTDTSDNNLHDPDSYIVTVPTAITFTGMNAGIVNQKVSYVTNVTGNIADNKSVKVTPDATTSLAGGSGNIKVTTKQAKSAWSFLDAYGNENSDGSRTGTDTTTTVDISGEAKSSDIYHGTIGFNVQLVDNIEYDYNYTGSIQTFTAPNTGTYLLEAWGAQSGGYVSDGSYYKNYTPGGYSVGSITLHKGDKLHIAVGGKGTDATYSSTDSVHGKGGWNGGGDGSDDAEDVSTESESLGGGGGATSIATSLINDGQLKNYKANQDKVLLVAGGAGSQDTKTDTTQDNTAGTRYGSGGGTNGNIGYVWPISDNYEKGAHVESSTQSAGYDFGQGENGDDNTMANHDGGGGGGGWYGGRTNTKYRWGGASGGSGYVSPLLTNGKMWQYLAETTNDITESTSSKSEKPNSMVAKFGNGYARISYLG